MPDCREEGRRGCDGEGKGMEVESDESRRSSGERVLAFSPNTSPVNYRLPPSDFLDNSGVQRHWLVCLSLFLLLLSAVLFGFSTSHPSAPPCGFLKMRWCLALLVFCFLAVANALSSSGNRLAVILEDAADKELYSTFWGDLQGQIYCNHTKN